MREESSRKLSRSTNHALGNEVMKPNSGGCLNSSPGASMVGEGRYLLLIRPIEAWT